MKSFIAGASPPVHHLFSDKILMARCFGQLRNSSLGYILLYILQNPSAARASTLFHVGSRINAVLVKGSIQIQVPAAPGQFIDIDILRLVRALHDTSGALKGFTGLFSTLLRTLEGYNGRGAHSRFFSLSPQKPSHGPVPFTPLLCSAR